MDRIRKYIRMEVEVEIFACAHITAMLFLYGFLQWLMYRGSVADGSGVCDVLGAESIVSQGEALYETGIPSP